MIRAKDLQNALLPLVGWQQHYNTSELRLSDAITQSESGLYFQQFHPLLTLQNLSSIAPDFKNIIYQEYSPEVFYKEGNIVQVGTVLYKAIAPSKNVDVLDTEYWAETNPFSEWLEGKTRAGIQKAIARFCNDGQARGTYKSLCENRTLFDGTGRLSDQEKNKNNIVGLEIIPVRSKGVSIKVNKIGIQFTEAGEYTLYLMHSSRSEPVKEIRLTKTKKNSFEWFIMDDLFLPYEGLNNEAGGSWFLCYDQSKLPENSQAIIKNKDWSKKPCSTCSRADTIAWNAWSKYFEVHPFYVNKEVVPEGELWDIADNMYTYDTNYGINLEVTVSCDITDFIIQQRASFQDVIAKQVAVDLLREFAYNANVRTNRNAVNASKTDVIYELDGDSASLKKAGLNYQLDEAFTALRLDLKGIDRVCMPCTNHGVKYRTI